jgi:hypothetical protein
MVRGADRMARMALEAVVLAADVEDGGAVQEPIQGA